MEGSSTSNPMNSDRGQVQPFDQAVDGGEPALGQLVGVGRAEEALDAVPDRVREGAVRDSAVAAEGVRERFERGVLARDHLGRADQICG
jgi:hypothetical protein